MSYANAVHSRGRGAHHQLFRVQHAADQLALGGAEPCADHHRQRRGPRLCAPGLQHAGPPGAYARREGGQAGALLSDPAGCYLQAVA